MPLTSAARKLSARPAEIWSNPLSTTSPHGLPRTVRVSYASSIATRSPRRFTHEAPYSWPPRSSSERGGGPRGAFPGPDRSGLLSLASAETVLLSASRRSRTERAHRALHLRPALLQRASPVETELVPAG